MPKHQDVSPCCHQKIPHPWMAGIEYCPTCKLGWPQHEHYWQPLFKGANAWQCFWPGCGMITYEPPKEHQ